MNRVVLDTNVLVSALLNPIGWEALALLLAIRERLLNLCFSEDVLHEYELVLPRPRLKLHPKEVEETLNRIRKVGRIVHPSRTVTVSRDPSDNRILECAEAASADYLVTGNKRHFPKTWGKTEVVNARELITLITPDIAR